ncbi:ankyrin repeat domain-containing protein SOWAHA-like [Pristis pectinata]|uniref:ankyrin repeat domain-containing protein SOWAHA-like n=1 Tax=Pristis pectinata TaxID=685728 RepID=UPI00223DAEE3|nr:ankyrin repeat domain-containing protein SOWAHA-like [Pristis pectinata]
MESGLSQEAVIKFLVDAGGKVENSKLLFNFRNELGQSDPQLKKEAREIFKSYINNVAVVREEGGVKYVVLKKKMQHLVAARQAVPPARQETGPTKGLGKVESLGNLPEAGERPQEPRARRNSAPSALSPGEARSLALPSYQPQDGGKAGSQDALSPGGDLVWRQGEKLAQFQRVRPANTGSLEQIAEKRCLTCESVPLEHRDSACEGLSSAPVSQDLKSPAVTANGNAVLASDFVPEPKRLDPLPALEDTLQFEQKIGNYEAKPSDVTAGGGSKMDSTQKPKPYMYPLRLPPDAQTCISSHSEQKKDAQDVQVNNNCPVASGNQSAPKVPKMKRSQSAEVGCSSPHLKRALRILKFPEDARFSDQVPLDPVEHEWIVKTALGHWTQVSGLLLKDNYLAEKKDFMSGFTAVHWAAKFGNSEIMCWIIDSSERNGIKMDINSKSHGGYTPLHIAAIHGRENVIVELVKKYNAITTLRDYSGKRPYHYLTKDSSFSVRQLLGDPETFISESITHKRGSRVASSILSGTNTLLGALADDVIFQEFSKSLKKQTNLSKFFTAPAGHKKRVKMRTNFTSLNEEPEEEEREEVVLKRRPVTEVFF